MATPNISLSGIPDTRITVSTLDGVTMISNNADRSVILFSINGAV
jgi:hypothetical protein